MGRGKKLIGFLVIIFVVIITYNILNRIMNDDFHKLGRIIGVDIPKDSTILRWDDGHGGFHGDGEAYAEIKLTKIGMEKFIVDAAKNEMWNDIPLPRELKIIINGGDYDGISYDIGKMSKNSPQDIQKGIYYLRDRFADNYPEKKHTDINLRSSYNVTISILDFETNKLYIYELDT
ncbi:hypothetical protein SDC9_166411 [bioreactor metagenome]|uniref:Uncharacterized protein n=1 Tax=bioreactor metagenome TaxID=1076179 RepID=A0A645FX78_9ZZZZ